MAWKRNYILFKLNSTRDAYELWLLGSVLRIAGVMSFFSQQQRNNMILLVDEEMKKDAPKHCNGNDPSSDPPSPNTIIYFYRAKKKFTMSASGWSFRINSADLPTLWYLRNTLRSLDTSCICALLKGRPWQIWMQLWKHIKTFEISTGPKPLLL